MSDQRFSSRHPWMWVPSLYLAEGLPYVVVMTVSVILYKGFGLSNTDIALYTSWLYLPWVIKPLWSPLVDITRTKRFWVVAMQFFISLGLALVAFSVRGARNTPTRNFTTCLPAGINGVLLIPFSACMATKPKPSHGNTAKRLRTTCEKC